MSRRTLVLLWAVVSSLQAQDNLKQISILHSNDLHASLLPDAQDQGGFARLATVIRREKANCEWCLYLNAGDVVQGSPVSTIYRGLPVYRVANLLGIDVSTLGNHEFDYGWRRLLDLVKTARFPIVSANVVNARGDSITGKPYLIKTVGGVRVGVIGVVLSDLVSRAFVSASDVGPWQVLPVVDTVRKYAHELRDRTDIIVVLGHIHDKGEVDEILKTIPEVAVVVAGHNHDEYPKMMEVDEPNGARHVAVLVKAYGDELGRLDLKVDVARKQVRDANWTKLAVDGKVAGAADVARAVAKWEGKVGKIVDVRIGETTVFLDKPAQLKLFRQAMQEATHADFVFLDQGSVRGDHDIPVGPIMARQIWNILPYDNYLVMGKFKGRDLPKVVMSGQTIDPDREYTLATTDFSASNQASPTQLGTTGLKFDSLKLGQREVVLNWIKNKNVIP